jgi:hypothetical protein
MARKGAVRSFPKNEASQRPDSSLNKAPWPAWGTATRRVFQGPARLFAQDYIMS